MLQDTYNAVTFTEFEQREPPVKRCTETINEMYPAESLLSELIQNAEDARATSFGILIDETIYGVDSLYSQKLESFQSEALVVYNDAIFEEKDFVGLLHSGVGSKKGDKSTIGRFGRGFSSVYNITDIPMVVTGNSIVLSKTNFSCVNVRSTWTVFT